MSKIYRPVIPIWIEEEDMRLIDADALIEKEERYELDHYIGGERCYQMVVPSWVIVEAPTIDAVEVVHGEWIVDKYGNVICSKCGWYAPKILTGCLVDRHMEYDRSKFCWNCGAKMGTACTHVEEASDENVR